MFASQLPLVSIFRHGVHGTHFCFCQVRTKAMGRATREVKSGSVRESRPSTPAACNNFSISCSGASLCSDSHVVTPRTLESNTVIEGVRVWTPSCSQFLSRLAAPPSEKQLIYKNTRLKMNSNDLHRQRGRCRNLSLCSSCWIDFSRLAGFCTCVSLLHALRLLSFI